MKHFNFWAFALTAIIVASCTSEDDLTLSPPANQANEETMAPIMFTSSQSAFTRANFEGAKAAEKLGNKFVVFGYKGSSTGTPGSTVFDNYLVEYTENTAHKTESNTANWEYVGKDRIHWAIEHGVTQQTIKYWDYSKAQYDFFAWSTGAKTAVYTNADYDTPASQVLVSAINATKAESTSTPATTGLTNAYTFTGTAEALRECYISDLVTVLKTGSEGTNTKVGYGNNVTLTFRQLGTKVRFGIYETIPGYSVKDVKFYTKAVSDENTDEGAETAVLFTTTAGAIRTEGTYTVYFPTVDQPSKADNNQAHIEFEPATSSGQTTLQNGTLTSNYTIAESGEKGEKYLGRSSNTATFAGNVADNYYKIFLPNEDGANLNLRVNYTLESIDGSGEEIEVKGATAQVPLIYTKWLPGYAYTYLFKISDKTNGYTGVYDPTNPNGNTTDSNPAGLYPITFDAVVVNAEEGDNTQETITTVSAPSITTYQEGSTVVNSNEYVAATGNIYVTVNDAPSASPDLPNGVLQDLTNKAALYKIPAGKTEAEVLDALQMQDDDNDPGTIKGRNGLVLTDISSSLTRTNTVEFGVDGNAITIPADGDEKKAAYFTPTANTTENPGKTYAFVYTKTAPDASGVTPPVVKYQPVAFSNTDVTTKYRYDLKTATAGDVNEGVFYFDESSSPYTSHTAFLGQTVNNLYTRTGNGTTEPFVYTPASGYAVTGTEYYYTIDGGRNYKKATNIAYASFGPATDIYTRSGAGTGSDPYVWTAKATTTTEPVSGTAYYQKTTVGSEDVYTYCVILPEQTTGLKVLDTTKYVQATESAAVTGMTYFDKYTVNYGVYYVKVIKVQ